jgi:diguanylate cyclase (GGDEF)-like protein
MVHHYIDKTSWLGGRYGVLFLVLVVCFLFAGIWTYQLLQGKERAIALAQANTANLVHIIEEANNRTLQAIDLTLNNIEIGIKRGRWTEDYDANTYLRSLLNESPQVREVAFADRTGRVTVTSRGEVPDTLSVKEETYFKKALEGTLPALYISSPQPGRLLGDVSQTGQWHLIMARAVYNDDGDFAGVALAVINPSFFQELIYALDIGKKGYVAYYRYDGILLMTSDSTSLDIDDANPANDLIFSEYLPKKEWGTFTLEEDEDDSSAYIISYRATSRWPVLVVVGLDQSDALAPWVQEVRDFTILIVVSILILLCLAVIVFSQHLSKERMGLKLIEAHHDTLTGIPSLRLCLDRLSTALIRAQREGDVLAVFFIDLDGFKAINDNHGHEAGDYVLQEVARRLDLCVRQMDTVGRLGGDEFLIILPKINDLSIVERIGASVITSVIKPIHWKDEQLSISASVGIALHPRDGNEKEQLIKKADKAMHEAKRNGKNQYALAKQ